MTNLTNYCRCIESKNIHAKKQARLNERLLIKAVKDYNRSFLLMKQRVLKIIQS